MNWPATHEGNMPEEIIHDYSLPQQMGYAESKYISERLFDEATRVSGVPTTICRVGQVAGPIRGKGIWREDEWFPSLIRSSFNLGCLPKDLGPMETIDWIPVDLLARSLVELFLKDTSHLQPQPTSQIYHLVNPAKTTYNTLLPSILSQSPSSSSSSSPSPSPPPKLVSLSEWLSVVEREKDDLTKNPAGKLLDFYKEMVEVGAKMVMLETASTEERSEVLRGMEAVRGKWVEGWMRGWGL